MSGAKKTRSIWKKTIIWFHGDLKPFFYEHKWPILFFFAVIAFICGFFGFAEIYDDRPVLSLVYLSMQLFTLRSGDYPGSIPVLLNIARFLAPALSFISVVVIVTGSFYYHLELLLLRFLYKDHVVICGLGYIGPVIAAHFCEQGFIVVVIEKDSMRSEIEYCKRKGSIVIIGDATEIRTLERAQIKKARYLFAVTGDDELNAKVIGQVKQGVTGRLRPLNCYVNIVDPKFANFLQAAQIPVQGESSIILEFVNIYQNSSLCILNCIPTLLPDKNLPDFHVIIIGLGRMGESLLIHLVRRWRKQYGKNPDKKIRITIVDRYADDKKKSIIARYTALSQYCEIDNQQMELSYSEFYEADFLLGPYHKKSVDAIFICTSDNSLNFATALYVNQKLKNNTIPIVVRTIRKKGFAQFFDHLSELNADQFRNIHAFPLVTCKCCIETLLKGINEVIAQALHESYLLHNQMVGAHLESDPALRQWKDLEIEFKEQNRNQAEKMAMYLNMKGYIIISRSDWDEALFEFNDDAEVEELASMEHNRWMDFMLENGWQFGEQKSLANKIHPDLVTWEKLPEYTKDIDRNFIRDYPSILALVDMKIIRKEELCQEKPKHPKDAWICLNEKRER